MTFTLEVNLDNSAFTYSDDQKDGIEMARILQKLACALQDTGMSEGDEHRVLDYNGNKVGQAVITD